MNKLKQTLFKLVLDSTNTKQRLVVYLEGGYYDTRFGPQDFSVNTLSTSIETAEEIIKQKYRVTRVILGVLVNNIGIVCGEDACVIPSKIVEFQKDENIEIPKVLKDMLDKSKITKRDPVIYTNEKTLRNRGLRIVKDIVDSTNKYDVVLDKNKNNEDICSVMIGNDKIPLAIRKGNTWAARCPLIMGQHYVDLYTKLSKKFGKDISVLIIDMGEMYDRHKMNNGAKIALLLLQKMYGFETQYLKIVNFSFQDDELTNFEYDITEGTK